MSITLKPVHILTGFLGSGKTTLLNRLLSQAEFSNTLVIINEFGEVPLDHHLIEKSTDTIVELSNGCLCCTVRGEMVDLLLELDTSQFDRVIVETTGIADPIPVYQSLTAQPVLAKGLRAGSIITVFDTLSGAALFKAHEEARKQLALADIVFLTMVDRNGDRTAAQQLISQHSPQAIITMNPEEIRPDAIDLVAKATAAHGNASHSDQYTSIILETERLLPIPIVCDFLHQLANDCGETLLRVKGLVKCPENIEKPILIQMSGQIVHDPISLPQWPNGTDGTGLVVIGKGIDHKKVKTLFEGFFGIMNIDTPDREAITGNPLSIPGL
ncbi:MAG: GTP-binding protein [Pseudomonadota bacterium]